MNVSEILSSIKIKNGDQNQNNSHNDIQKDNQIVNNKVINKNNIEE